MRSDPKGRDCPLYSAVKDHPVPCPGSVCAWYSELETDTGETWKDCGILKAITATVYLARDYLPETNQ